MKYTRVKRKFNFKKYGYEILLTIVGCFIMACGTSLFLLPNKLSTGGFSGIATIAYFILNLPIGITILVLNIPLFIIGYLRLGKIFFSKTIIGTLLLSVFIDLLEKAPPLTHNQFLASVYGGIVVGIGSAINLKAMASTGGSDLLAYIIRSFKPYYQTSTLIIGIDTVIVALNVFFLRNIEIGLYSAIAIFLMGKMIDLVFEGVNFTKIILIISDKYEQIAKKVEKTIERGSTAIYAKGMYKKEDKMMLLCVASRNEVSKIKQLATNIDENAFIIITNARETWGEGFRK